MQLATRSRARRMIRLATALATLLAAGAAAAAAPADDEPLEPEKAFVPQATLAAGIAAPGGQPQRHGIDIEYRIAPGYYLYRDRLRFEVATSDLRVGPPEIPPGLEVDDPFLGKSAIFRDRVTIHLPFLVSAAPAGRYRVRITAQGCAEDRVCYSPFRQEVAVTIPPGYRAKQPPAAPAPKGVPR